MDEILLKKVQRVQLDIAKEFKHICDTNNLKYMAEAGTLLGAIRHNGFIPWDDDMDFSMPREDYNKFFIIAQGLNNDYKPVRWDITEGYPHPFGKFVKKNTVFREEKMEKSYGIYIDIFPWDNLPDENIAKKIYKIKLMSLRAMMRAKCGCKTYRRNGKIIISKLIKNLPFIVLSIFISRDSIISSYEKLASKYNEKQTDKIVLQDDTPIGNWSTSLALFVDQGNAEFEDTFFSIPGEYDKYLSERYGNYNRLPPEDKRNNQHLIVEVKI